MKKSNGPSTEKRALLIIESLFGWVFTSVAAFFLICVGIFVTNVADSSVSGGRVFFLFLLLAAGIFMIVGGKKRKKRARAEQSEHKSAHDRELFVCEFKDSEGNYHPVYFYDGMVKPEKTGDELVLAPHLQISTETTYGNTLSLRSGTKAVIKSMSFYKKVVDNVFTVEKKEQTGGSVVGAAVAGAVVAGAAGAVVGAVAQASKNATSAPKTTQEVQVLSHADIKYYPTLRKGSGLYYRIDRLKIRKDIAEEMGSKFIGNGRFHKTDDTYYIYELGQYYLFFNSNSKTDETKEVSDAIVNFLNAAFERYSK